MHAPDGATAWACTQRESKGREYNEGVNAGRLFEYVVKKPSLWMYEELKGYGKGKELERSDI